MPPLTIEKLKEPHSGYQRNPQISTIFYYAGFIEAWGSGILKMSELCQKVGLPAPDFIEHPEGIGAFTVVFYKDIYNEENLRKMGLSERQIKAVLYVKEKEKISNQEYQALFSISRQTASRDFSDLVKKKILVVEGTGKRNLFYKLKVKNEAKDSQMRQK